MKSTLLGGLEITGPIGARHEEILTPEACAFLAGIFKKFGARREELLARRVARQCELDAGQLPDFPAATAHIRCKKNYYIVSIHSTWVVKKL